MVIEVKRDWDLSKNNTKVLEQVFAYALRVGARFAIISNGDYYAVYDGKKGLSYEEMFATEFRISEFENITNEQLSILQKA